jgi:thioredoxin reductase (NADPH)
LRAHYAKDYRVLGAGSGEVALETLRQLVGRGEPIALLLVDQRMPRMSGIDFLGAAGPLSGEAAKVLLTAYADTEAAIRAINQVGLDHYLMKPWDPRKTGSIRAGRLVGRMAAVATALRIRVVGALWSPGSHRQDFLARHQIRTFGWTWTWTSRRGSWARTKEETLLLPAVLFPDGTSLGDPLPGDLAEARPAAPGGARLLRCGDHRRRTGRAGGGGLRQLEACAA